MEPELPTPRLNPERAPAPIERGVETLPEQPSPELSPERSAERYEQRSEASAAVSDSAPIVLPTVVPTQVPADDSSNVLADDDIPSVAADDDLIEKEWVDKAKQVIAKTKDDPYQREQEISRLQVEYLRKRYGKELDTSNQK